MTNEAHPPMTDVAALMHERRKYEAWLAALEARRATTAVHVFDRVKRDYEDRLERVMGELLSHRDALEQRVRELDERIHGLESSEQQRRDQRAEMELRAHVGELRDLEFEQAVREVDAAIARAESERGELRDELSRASELLVAVTMPRAIPAIDAPAAAPVPAPIAAPPPPPAPAAAPTAAAPVPPPPQPFRRPSIPVRAPAAPAELAAAAAAPAPAPPAERPRDAQVAPAGDPPAEVRSPAVYESLAPEPEPAPAPRASGFDELAFLQSIVGAEAPRAQQAAAPVAAPPEPARPPEPEPQPPPRPAVQPLADLHMIRDGDTGAGSLRASQASGVVNDENVGASLVSRMPETRQSSEMPMAANVTGNHPIVLRQAGDAATPKTLKCNECGSMNYPTEWYCERCGAELAAL